VFRVAVLSFWHVHAQDYALEAEEHPEAEVCALWDEDGERGRMEASERRVPFHEDLDELLSREDLDGVIVTTPTVAHREVIPTAASAGKHVFAEKVIAPTLHEAREAVAKIEEAGVTLVVSLPRLYAGYTRATKEALTSGEIGEPTYLRVRVAHDGALPSAASLRGWLPERFFDPRQSAGGVTIDFGAHPLYLLGAPARDARRGERRLRPLHREARGGPLRRGYALPRWGPGGRGGLLPWRLRTLFRGGTRHRGESPLRPERRSQDAPP
jgi:1,5-anhydro-D-fructose reductase (1,5-anhydro-D-mannitol-forming)